MDGVNSMTGNAPDLPAFAAVAREHGALLYVDDAHGFGVIGERSPGETSPYGMRGNSVVRHAGETYDNLVLVGGFSKAYSSLLAFIACPTRGQGPPQGRRRRRTCTPARRRSRRSPPCSPASTSTSGAATSCRRVLCGHTRRVLECLERLGVATPNRSGFPIVEIPLRDHRRIAEVGQFLFDRGVYVTLAAYPLVPKDEVGFRVQLTAANTDAEIDTLIAALEELADRGELARVDAVDPDAAVAGAVAMRRRAAASPSWQAYLAAGRPALRALRLRAAVRRQRPADEPPRALAGHGDPRRRAAATGRRRARPWRCFAVGFLLFWLGDLYTYSYRAAARRRGAVPLARRRRLRPRLPGAHGRPALARRAAATRSATAPASSTR